MTEIWLKSFKGGRRTGMLRGMTDGSFIKSDCFHDLKQREEKARGPPGRSPVNTQVSPTCLSQNAASAMRGTSMTLMK